MERSTQRVLSKWLKAQSKPAKFWLRMTVLCGFGAGIALIVQAGLLAHILHELIIESTPKTELVSAFFGIVLCSVIRAGLNWLKEFTGFRCGELVRLHLRSLVLERLNQLGPAYIKGRPAGAWSSLLLEQIEEMQDFFAKYLPQMSLSALIPLAIIVVVFPMNWAAGLIFLITAPLVPVFMALVGMGAADANKRNFKALQRLSGHFLDRLRGMQTLRLFNYAEKEADNLHVAAHVLRKRTMEVLRLAFLSSAVLEFFAALSVALVAVYFGFAFIGEINFGYYGAGITLFTGLFILILAPEFYQPMRELGVYYHARAQAIASAESLMDFLQASHQHIEGGAQQVEIDKLDIIAKDLEIYSTEGVKLVGPVDFTIRDGEKVALVGQSGAGKSTIMNALLGFLPYQGSLTVNSVELKQIDFAHWRQQLSWVGQNPMLLHGSVAENIALSQPNAEMSEIQNAAKQAYASEFIDELPNGYQQAIGDRSSGLSVGQAQRIALARAILQSGHFWLLDEPTASLDADSERTVITSLQEATQSKTTLMISHQLSQLEEMDTILVLKDGLIAQQGTFSAIKENGLMAEMLSHTHNLEVSNA
ncbi:heme ABC transporter permease/ATP-binding protein CydD [Thaumasiovibrio subtropicus]|uniref:heme ABC transporter permease/ATP-binding protein CydD n=1 Tax=Thaumasiovibrio subtropicus TaxID=1891207 RepID=UPI000B34F797|nr:cysteine/glutathione ABC transporter permease/ATP-binding protein CydD [Thaumasiovibrio subtropicus]